MKNIHISHINSQRGLFSEFFTILSGIEYCMNTGNNFYITWINELYSNSSENIFNKYFHQKTNENEYFHEKYEITTPYGQKFSIDIQNCWQNKLELHNVFETYSKVIKKSNLLDSDFIKSIETNYFQGDKVLGVHKRGTDHSFHGEILSDEYFFEKIEMELNENQYEKIFLITDDLESYNNFSEKYGGKLITTDSIKSRDGLGVHYSGQNNREKLARDVIRDSILLSQTNKKIVTQSNVAYFSILYNLTYDNYEFIDNHIKYK
jgi:hypothetical protein